MSESSNEKPLVVGMAKAEFLLDCGYDTIYDLIKAGELDSYLEGNRRKITIASIEALIEKRLAASRGKLDRSQLLEKRVAAGRARRREANNAEPVNAA